MSIPCKFERSILSHDEHEMVLGSHHPGIYGMGLGDLKELRRRLRDMRDKDAPWRARSAGKCAVKARREAEAFPVQRSIRCSANRYSPLRSSA